MAKNGTLYTIKITNWNKHNPNMKSSFKYTKISNNFCTDGKLSVLPLSHRWLFLALLLEAGNSNSDTLVMSERQIRVHLESSRSITRVLDSLQSFQVLTYQKKSSLINIREEKRREEKRREEKIRGSRTREKPPPETTQKSLEIFDDTLSAEPTHPLFKIWNNFSGSLPKAKGLSKTRIKHADSLWRQENNEAYWIEVVKKITASDFCTGNNDRAWIATFDWFLKPDTHLKVMEGKFDTRTKTGMYMTHGMKIAHNSQIMSREIKKMMALEEEENDAKEIKDVGPAC